MKFIEKYYGRIYVEKPEQIEQVKKIIEEMDEFEYGYLPKDLIAVYNGRIDYEYTGKFYAVELDELMAKCWGKGIKAFYVVKTEDLHLIALDRR